MRIPVLALVLILCASAPALRQDDAPKSPLLECMKGMKDELKGIAMALQGGKQEAALSHLAAMQALVLRAKLESPPNLDEVPESARDAHRVGFRKDLIRVLKELATMEELVLDGDLSGAFQRVVDPLYPMRENAHEIFQRE